MGDNKATVNKVYEAFSQGDVPGVLGVMDPKIDWQEPDSLPFENQIGPEAVAEGIFGKIFELFSEFSVNPDKVYESGDTVFCQGQYRGKSTGGDLDTQFVHVWRFGDDGKVTGFRTYTDTHNWLKALGQA